MYGVKTPYQSEFILNDNTHILGACLWATPDNVTKSLC